MSSLRLGTYYVDFDCPVGKVTINGNQTFRNKNPACCDAPGPTGKLVIIGNCCTGLDTEKKENENQISILDSFL